MKIPELIEKFNRKIEKFNSVLNLSQKSGARIAPIRPVVPLVVAPGPARIVPVAPANHIVAAEALVITAPVFRRLFFDL